MKKKSPTFNEMKQKSFHAAKLKKKTTSGPKCEENKKHHTNNNLLQLFNNFTIC